MAGAICYFQPLRAEVELELGKTRRIATWPREAGDQTSTNRISDIHEYDGRAAAGPLQRRNDSPSGSQNNVRLEHDQFGGGFSNQITFDSTRPILDLQVLAFYPAQLPKFFAKCADLRLSLWVRRLIVVKDTDPAHARGLLR